MLDNVYVWIAAIVVIGAIVGLAVFLGRGLTLTKDNGKYKIETKEKQTPDTRTNEITVARDMEIKDSEAGDIAGRKGTSSQPVGDRPEHIDVATGAKIERTKVGDITGVKQEGSAPPDKDKKA